MGVSLSLSFSFPPSLSMLSSPSGSSDSDDSSKRDGGERREDDSSERARQQQQQQDPIASSSGAHAAPPRPPLALSDAEAAAAGAALKRARATARARRKGSLLTSSLSAPRAHAAVRLPGAAAGAAPGSRAAANPPAPPRRILDPSGATSDADAAARLRAWLSSTLSRPGAARSGAYARHRAAVVRKALSLLETKRSEAQDAELQALLGGLSL